MLTMPTVSPLTAHLIARDCSDAYSALAYGRSWIAVARMLAKRGFTAREIEAIMRSKWTRWAIDSHATNRHRYGSYPASLVAAFLDSYKDKDELRRDVATLVQETFSSEACCDAPVKVLPNGSADAMCGTCGTEWVESEVR